MVYTRLTIVSYIRTLYVLCSLHCLHMCYHREYLMNVCSCIPTRQIFVVDSSDILDKLLWAERGRQLEKIYDVTIFTMVKVVIPILLVMLWIISYLI